MGELDELREEVEELRDEIQELKQEEDSEDESDGEDEGRTLYIYIQHVTDTREVLGMEMEEREVLLLEENNSYRVPQEPEAEFASTTRQVIQHLKALDIDAWENVKRLGERENAVYYKAIIPPSMAKEVSEGAWVKKAEATKLVSDMEAREYL